MTTPDLFTEATTDAERRFEKYRQHMHAELKPTGDPELDREIHNDIDELVDKTISEYHEAMRGLRQ